MAETVAQAIKDVQKSLDMLDKKLMMDEQNWKELGTVITQTMQNGKVSIEDFYKVIASKMSVKDALKFKLIVEKDDIMKNIKTIQSALDNKKIEVKIGDDVIKGTKAMETALTNFKTQLKMIPKTAAEAYDYLIKVANTLNGTTNKNNYSPISKQRIKDERDVQKIQEQTTVILQRRIELQERINSLKPNGKAWRETKEELERVNRDAQNYLATLGSLGTAGARQIKAFKDAGLISNAESKKISDERLQIDLLRQRMQAEQQLNRLLIQRDNATLAGKNISTRVSDSIARLQERVDTIDRQRASSYQNFTQASLQKIEGMWQNHETALTNIKTQGEQARQRIESRQNEQAQMAAQKQIIEILKQRLSIENQVSKLKQAPQQTQVVQQQIQNLTRQYVRLGQSMQAISNGDQSLINQAQAQIAAQKQKQQNLRNTADALRDAKNQEKAYNDGVKQMQKDEDTARKSIIALMRQQLSIQSQLNRLQNAPATQAVLGQVQNLTSQYQLLGQQIKNIANGNQKLVQSAQQYVAAQAQAQQNAQQTTKAINTARQQAQQQAQLARQQAQQQAQAARQRAAIERKADSESIANQKRQIQIKAQLSAIDKARNTIRDTTSKKAKAQIEAENAEYKRLSAELTRLIARQKELNTITQGSATRAKSRLQTYEIQASEAALRKYEEVWRRINNTQNKNKYTLQEMLPIVQRLGSALGIAFSVQGLVQFGKKIVETRGKFEMQFVAMKQIIGDVDAATKLWNQTMQQALQSPFTAMQLVDYTKKLAAYRIETNKLFETTKRLADVSAGLGVDMGRLILAYGQVKTANYLRASEVRQFTEAGVNIYGELAKYFTEIEGRAVGTAEVVNRVSKRMVLFTDVEKIFQRMTEEGGAFFNMQEVQADTVRGQIMKLRDAYDQMLNSIGQAKDGTIRGLVDSLNNMVRNWQNVAFVLKANVNWITLFGGALLLLSRNYLKNATTQTLWFGKSILGTSKALLKNTADVRLLSTALGDYTFKQRAAIVATRTFQGALGALGKIFRTIAPFLAFELLVVGIERLTRANRELNRMKKELKDVASSNTDQMREEINGYGTLIEKLKKTTDGTYARKEVLDEISQKYGKYLDFIITETTSVEDLAGAYDKVVGSIRNYTAEKIREEQRQRVEKSMYDEYQELVGNLTGKRISDTAGNQIKITKTQAQNVAKLVQQSLEKYGAANIEKILETYFGNQFNFSIGGANTGTITDISSYIKEWKDLKSELDDIRDEIEKETPVFQSDKEYNNYKKRVEEANAALAEQAERNEEINNLIKKNNKEQWQAEDALNKQRIANTEAELRIRKEYGLITQKEYDDELARLHGQLDSYEKDYNLRLEKALQSASSFGNLWRILDKDARDIYNYVESTEDRLQQGTEQRNKQLVENYKGLKESLKEYNAALIAAQKTGANDESLKQIQKNIDWTTLMMKAIELAAKLRGLDLSGKKHTSGVNYDSISSLISLLKEMNSEYEKLSKSAYGYAKSNEKVVESFSPAFKEIFGFAGIDISQVDTTSKQATADAMKLVIDTLDNKDLWGRFGKDGGKKARKEFVKAWGQMAVEADLEVAVRVREDFKREIEEMFGNYELSLELNKLNIPQSVLSEMFDIDSTSLADIRERLNKWYEEMGADLNEGFFKEYQGYLKKIDDEERKLQQQRLKDYSKYLEYQLSERAKAEMEYLNKLAVVQSESAFTSTQKKQIADGLKKEYEEAMGKLDWEDFKGSEFYVGMFEDLDKQGSASLDVMRNALIELRKNAKNLSPRAMKELVKDLEKIDEIERSRKPPFQRMREEAEKLNKALDGRDIREVFKELAGKQSSLKSVQDSLKLTEEVIGAKTDEIKINEILENQEKISIKDALKRLEAQRASLKARKAFRTKESEDPEKFRNETKEINNLQRQIEQTEAYINAYNKYQEIQNLLNDPKYAKYKGMSIEDLLANRDDLKENAKGLDEQIQLLQSLIDTWDRYQKAILDSYDEAAKYIQLINGAISSTFTMMQNYGYATDELSKQWQSMANALATSGVNITNALKDFNSSKNNWTKSTSNIAKSADWITMIIKVVLELINVIGEAGLFDSARIDKEIREHQEKIDKLNMAYSRLERQIERTWDTVSYMQSYDEMVANLQQQIEQTEAQLAAARDRKNQDQSEINGLTNDLIGLRNQLEDLDDNMTEMFGGIGKAGYRSAAEGFVEAWKQAFLETGNGLDGLQEHFNEFLQDWFVKQAVMSGATSLLEPVIDEINKAVDPNGEGGARVMYPELERVYEVFGTQRELLDEYLKNMADMYSLSDSGSLSGLAAGIQGMTEEQANVLEAYWNSVRMYAANIDMNVSRIAEMLGVGGPNSNPMLTHLQAIANNTAFIPQIYSLLNGSTKNMGNGRGFVTYQL